MEWTSCDVCIIIFMGLYLKQMLHIGWCSMISIAIPNTVADRMQISLCSSQSSISPLTESMPVNSLESMSCNIQHLAHHDSQHKYRGHCIATQLFITSGYQIQQINTVRHRTTLLFDWRQVWFKSSKCPSSWNIAWHMIQTNENRRASATNWVSVWKTQVVRTALTGTSYPLADNYKFSVSQAMGRVAYLPPIRCA